MIRHDNDWPQRTLAWHAKLILEVQQHVLLELELEARVCLRGKGRALLPARQGVEAFTTYAFGCIPRTAMVEQELIDLKFGGKRHAAWQAV